MWEQTKSGYDQTEGCGAVGLMCSSLRPSRWLWEQKAMDKSKISLKKEEEGILTLARQMKEKEK